MFVITFQHKSSSAPLLTQQAFLSCPIQWIDLYKHLLQEAHKEEVERIQVRDDMWPKGSTFVLIWIAV